MKKKILIVLIVLFIIFVFNIGLVLNSSSFAASNTKKIVFEDKNLYNVVKGNTLIDSSNDDELSIEIDESSLENFTSLNCNSEAITSIKGIENFKYLKVLNLDNNKGLSDISVLSNLTNLETLSIEGLELNNIDFVKDLTNLETLNLNNNKINNIDVLQNLVNLNMLNIEDNKITDLSSLENLKNLETLRFTNNLLDQDDVKEINKLINNIDNLEFIRGGINVVEDTFVLPDIFMDEENIFPRDCELTEDKTKMMFSYDTTECSVDINDGKYENSTMEITKVTKDFLNSQIKESKSLSSNTQSNNIVIFAISIILTITLVFVCIILLKKGNINKKVLIGLIVLILIFLTISICFGIKSFVKNTQTTVTENIENNEGKEDSEEKGEAININGYDVYIGTTTYDDFVNNTKFNETKKKKSNNANGVNFSSYNSDGYSTLEVIVKNNIIQAIFINSGEMYDDFKFDSEHTTFILPGEITIGDDINKAIEYYGDPRISSNTYVYFDTNVGAKTDIQLTVDKNTNKIQDIYVGLTY